MFSANIFKVIVLIIGLMVIGLDAGLYIFCKQQRSEISLMKDQQKMDAEVNAKKFKYQQDQLDHLTKDLMDAQGQVKDQKDALSQQKEAFLEEIEKRKQVEDQNKSIQTSLIDIKAEADAIKQDMKIWQKDYVTVLAELEKKMDDSQAELKENINSLKTDIEKIVHPADNNLPGTSPIADKKIEGAGFENK